MAYIKITHHQILAHLNHFFVVEINSKLINCKKVIPTDSFHFFLFVRILAISQAMNNTNHIGTIFLITKIKIRISIHKTYIRN